MTNPRQVVSPAAEIRPWTDTRLQPLAHCSPSDLVEVRFVLCDLDDTLTLDGRLPSASYVALEALEATGRRIIVVTGRPAGWCDMIARLWPVSAVVGENGAFYFRYDHAARKMRRRYQRSAEQSPPIEPAWTRSSAKCAGVFRISTYRRTSLFALAMWPLIIVKM